MLPLPRHGHVVLPRGGIGSPANSPKKIVKFTYSVKVNIYIKITYLELLQVSLDGLARLSIGLVGVVQRNFQLVNVRLQLLLDSECFLLSFALGLQRCLRSY